MAEVAARHIAGDADARVRRRRHEHEAEAAWAWTWRRIGDALGTTPGALDYVYTDPVGGIYKKLVVSGDGKTLLGAILVGDAAEYGTLLQMTLNGIPLPAHPEDLILPAREGGASKGLGVDMLPAAAQICSCNDVTKGAHLRRGRRGGCTTVGALKTQTKASSTCGGCGPLVKQILEAELTKARRGGEEPPLRALPPLAPGAVLTRARSAASRRSRTSLAKHGKGRGCDICKPAVASILAACWNEHILKPRHAPLQDTNDHFLANLQKDGTYSVVPRVPGGEITPEKLIVLGEVAKKFGLYTKITGGAAHRPLRRARRAAAAHLERAGGRRLRVGPRLRQGAAHGEVLRRQHLVPLRRAGLGLDGDRAREPLPGPARAAQAQDGGLGLHPRMRRGAGQGRRRHRHRERLEPLRLRQRRHEAAARRPAREGSRRRDAVPLHRPLPHVLHPHRRPAAAHQHLAREPRRRHGLRAAGGVRGLARHRRRARSRHAEARRHLRVRVEESDRTTRRSASASATS